MSSTIATRVFELLTSEAVDIRPDGRNVGRERVEFVDVAVILRRVVSVVHDLSSAIPPAR